MRPTYSTILDQTLDPKALDPVRVPGNAIGMADTLTDRVYKERIKILQAKFDKSLEQRDHFAGRYHEVARIPHQERREIIEDCDREIELAGKLPDAGSHD